MFSSAARFQHRPTSRLKASDGSAEFAGDVQVGAQIRIKGNALSTSNSQVQYNGTVAYRIKK